MVRPYARLAPYYDKEWTAFSLSYVRIVKRLNLCPADRFLAVLDVACGTGALAAALTEMGFTVTGIDLSAKMLGIARSASPRSEFVMANMVDFELRRKFELATCAFDSLNYLPYLASLRAAFQCIGDHLVPKGNFLFDINTAALYEDNGQGTIHRCIDGAEFDQTWSYEPRERTARTVFRFANGDVEEHIQRTYEREEIEGALAASGFTTERVFEDEDCKPPTERCSKVYFLAGKGVRRNA